MSHLAVVAAILGSACASYGGGVDITATFDRLRVRNAGTTGMAW